MPSVNSSMSSRAKFSLGWAATLVAVSSHRCMAGSLATAAVRVSKLPPPRVRNSWFCRYIKAGAANLFEPGGEVARPEKGELLAERGGRHDHPVDPPCLEGGLLAVLFLALLGGRLQVLGGAPAAVGPAAGMVRAGRANPSPSASAPARPARRDSTVASISRPPLRRRARRAGPRIRPAGTDERDHS